MAIYNLYEPTCSRWQAFLGSHIPELSQDFVKTSAINFMFSFAVSTICFDKSVASGLKGGAMAIIATTIHVTCMTLMRNLNIYYCKFLNKPHKSIDSEGKHCAMLMAFGGSLYFGHVLGLALNSKATFFVSVPSYIFTNNNRQTPIFGTVIA